MASGRSGAVLMVAGSLAALAGVVGLWYGLGLAPAEAARRAPTRVEESPLQRVGTYGDSFGAVNSLASSLALAGVAVALLLQWQERRDARREAAEESRRHADRAAQDAEMMMLSSMIVARCILTLVKCDIHRFNMRVWREEKVSRDTYESWQRDYNQEHGEDIRSINELMGRAFERFSKASEQASRHSEGK